MLTEPTYTGEFILSEAERWLSRDQASVASDPSLKAGTVLGRALTSGLIIAAPAALGTNAGNPTFNTPTAGAGAMPGVYVMRMEDATHFVVEDPDGVEIGHGVHGSAFSAGGIGFTSTAGGTADVAGDSFSFAVTIGAATYQYKRLNPSATDGSQVAAAVWFGPTTTGAADPTQSTVISRDAQLKAWAIDWGSCTTAQIATATAQLAELRIILR